MGYIISMTMQEATESYADLDKEILGYTVQGKPINRQRHTASRNMSVPFRRK